MPRLSQRIAPDVVHSAVPTSAAPAVPEIRVAPAERQEHPSGGLATPPNKQTIARPVASARPLAVPAPPDHPFLKEPRRYRQPDGRLGPKRPPRDPYTVASRRAWEDIVRYARLTSSGPEKRNGGEAYRSFRYGFGVSFEAHATYVQQLGMEPECGADGTWIGFDATRQDPLLDERHPLSSLKRPVSTVDAAAA